MFQVDTKERRARPGTFGGCPRNVFLRRTPGPTEHNLTKRRPDAALVTSVSAKSCRYRQRDLAII